MREDNKKKITHYMDNVAGRRVDLLHRQILSFEAALKNSHPVSVWVFNIRVTPLQFKYFPFLE